MRQSPISRNNEIRKVKRTFEDTRQWQHVVNSREYERNIGVKILKSKKEITTFARIIQENRSFFFNLRTIIEKKFEIFYWRKYH